ncbi:MAG: gluconokinase [Planctomycetia bacterium]|nr:gluconokinase [Planctomycetia bacterium]
MKPVVVLMGVCGCGKTEIGRLLAARLGCDLLDGDDFHPPANVEKMRSGIPLTDADRWPWLDRLAAAITARLKEGSGAVVACSALARRYRDRLGIARPGVMLVHLAGDRDLLAARLAARQGHFMPPALLDSQLAALEPPALDEHALTIDVATAPPDIVGRIERAIDRGGEATRPASGATGHIHPAR